MRTSGVLLPISSLPSRFGIGCFSKEAYAFVDRLKEAGQKYWQILPLGPTGYGDSPYQSFSTYAGNPYFIDLEALIEKKWLTEKECLACDFGDNESYIDYEKLYNCRFKLLRKAFKNSKIEKDADFKAFIAENASWLDDYALYMAVKTHFKNICWVEWDEDIKLRKPAAMKKYRKEFTEELLFYQFQQYLFRTQWLKLKAYANEQGVELIGDIPIYVAFDSADAWANPELFQFDENCVPVAVAGCPPDPFAVTGQLWGNPLYNWEYHKSTGYDWWMKRLAACFQLYDVVRIDHFRGFDEYYSIPYGDPTAEFGTWKKGPGYDLFATMKKVLGDKKVIAEDLGFLTPSVIRMVKRTGYPGMKILMFAFDSTPESGYLPHNYDKNCVVYTGTHDNETVVGWYKNQNRQVKQYIKDYLQLKRCNAKQVCREFVRLAQASVANMCVIPMQDYLELGNEARINTPSTLGDNWKWRMSKDAFTPELAESIRKMTETYGRLAK